MLYLPWINYSWFHSLNAYNFDLETLVLHLIILDAVKWWRRTCKLEYFLTTTKIQFWLNFMKISPEYSHLPCTCLKFYLCKMNWNLLLTITCYLEFLHIELPFPCSWIFGFKLWFFNLECPGPDHLVLWSWY